MSTDSAVCYGCGLIFTASDAEIDADMQYRCPECDSADTETYDEYVAGLDDGERYE